MDELKCFLPLTWLILLVGFNTLSSYSSQGGGGGQGFGSGHGVYHGQGYGRGDDSMNYQYR